MSHYPPGVTGREPQLMGSRGEVTREVECTAKTDGHFETDGIGIPTTWLETLQLAMAEALDPELGAATRGSMRHDWRLRAVKADLDVILGRKDEVQGDVECPWDGPVELTVWNRDEAGADCPICGRELTVDLSD